MHSFTMFTCRFTSTRLNRWIGSWIGYHSLFFEFNLATLFVMDVTDGRFQRFNTFWSTQRDIGRGMKRGKDYLFEINHEVPQKDILLTPTSQCLVRVIFEDQYSRWKYCHPFLSESFQLSLNVKMIVFAERMDVYRLLMLTWGQEHWAKDAIEVFSDIVPMKASARRR